MERTVFGKLKMCLNMCITWFNVL